MGLNFLCAECQATGYGDELVAGSNALLTKTHFENATHCGNERSAAGEEDAIHLAATYAEVSRSESTHRSMVSSSSAIQVSKASRVTAMLIFMLPSRKWNCATSA